LVTGLALGAIMAKHLTDAPEVRGRWRGYVFVATALLLQLAHGFVKQHSGAILPLRPNAPP
jgi:hypothetical protein